MQGAICALILALVLLTPENSSSSIANANAKIALQLQEAPTGKAPQVCQRVVVSPCNPGESSLSVQGSIGVGYDLYILVLDGSPFSGIAGASFGINFGSNILVSNWTLCADTNYPGGAQGITWPQSGSGNVVTWNCIDNCQNSAAPGDSLGEVTAIIGAFYVYAYADDLFEITPRTFASPPDFSVADCVGGQSFPPYDRNAGRVAFGTLTGFDPCLGDTASTSSEGGGNAAYIPDRVIVRFAVDAVRSRESEPRWGSIEDFTIPSSRLRDRLHSIGTARIRRLLAHFDSGSKSARATDGSEITLPVDMADVYVIDLADTNVSAAIRELKSVEPEVVYAEPDYIMRTTSVPDDTYFGQQWWLNNLGQISSLDVTDINAPEAWNYGVGGVETDPRPFVGILDTGVDYEHDFGRFGGDLNVPFGIRFQGAGSATDVSPTSHGTAVAGIIGSVGNNSQFGAGINWNIDCYSIAVFDASNGGATASLVSGLEHARVNNYPIVNFSGSGPYSACLAEEMKNSHASGMLIVASMGNNNQELRVYPAGYDNFALAVGAVYSDGLRWDDSVLDSQYGCYPPWYVDEVDTLYLGSNFGSWIDIAAPGGRDIATTERMVFGGFKEVSGPCSGAFGGTSAAAPVVTGVASLVYSLFYAAPSGFPINPLTGEDLEQVLTRTATDVTTYGSGRDPETGWGIVDAQKAVEYVANGRGLDKGIAYGQTNTTSQERVMRFIGVGGLDEERDYYVTEWEFRKNVSFAASFLESPDAWGKSFQSTGWSNVNPHDETTLPPGFSEVVPGTITTSGMVVRTYFYEVYDQPGHVGFIDWYPLNPAMAYPDNVRMSWTAFGPLVSTGITDSDERRGVTLSQTSNPVLDRAQISFSLQGRSRVTLQVFDIQGRRVRLLADNDLPSGKHEYTWDLLTDSGQHVAGGAYFYQLRLPRTVLTRKVVVLR